MGVTAKWTLSYDIRFRLSIARQYENLAKQRVNVATNGETTTVPASGAVDRDEDETLAALEQRYRTLQREVTRLRNELAELKQQVENEGARE
jgi:hypothetical protein